MIAAIGEIKGFDAKAVARKNDAPAISLPDREREHAVKALDAARAPLFICFEDDFGVALGKEAIAFFPQFAAQLAKIIDAAVERDREPKFAVDHRLVGRRFRVENAKTPMSQANTILREQAVRIRPASS